MTGVIATDATTGTVIGTWIGVGTGVIEIVSTVTDILTLVAIAHALAHQNMIHMQPSANVSHRIEKHNITGTMVVQAYLHLHVATVVVTTATIVLIVLAEALQVTTMVVSVTSTKLGVRGPTRVPDPILTPGPTHPTTVSVCWTMVTALVVRQQCPLDVAGKVTRVPANVMASALVTLLAAMARASLLYPNSLRRRIALFVPAVRKVRLKRTRILLTIRPFIQLLHDPLLL